MPPDASIPTLVARWFERSDTDHWTELVAYQGRITWIGQGGECPGLRDAEAALSPF